MANVAIIVTARETFKQRDELLAALRVCRERANAGRDYCAVGAWDTLRNLLWKLEDTATTAIAKAEGGTNDE